MGWGSRSPQDYELDKERRSRMSASAKQRQLAEEAPAVPQVRPLRRIRQAIFWVLSWRIKIYRNVRVAANQDASTSHQADLTQSASTD